MPPKHSLAMVHVAPRRLEARSLPVPEIGHDTALLRIEACGICGSDYEQYEGLLRTPMPVVPGHEPLGIIEAIGDGAARRWGVDVGDRVAVETMIACHACSTCLGGSYHLCARKKVYSYVPLTTEPGLWGAYAEYMYLDAGSVVHRIDASLPGEHAVMFNPLGAGFRWGVEIPGTGPGDTVAILGPGQRGLSCVVACRQVGAGKIFVTGLAADERKLALARRFGADATIDVESEDPVRRIRELTDGRGVDVVVDVSSYATAPIVQAIDMVRPGGTVVLAGVKGFKAVPDLVSDKIVLKEVQIRGAIGVTSSGYRSAIRMLEARATPLVEMHTHRFALRDAERAIRTLAREIEGDESIHSCLVPDA